MTENQLETPLSVADEQLLHACLNKDIGELRAALEAGASVEARLPMSVGNHGGKAGMHLAAQFGFYEGLRALRDHGANIEAEGSRNGNSPLMWAIDGNNYGSFSMLLEMGANVWHENAEQMTPMEMCDMWGLDIHGSNFGDLARHYSKLPEKEDIEGITLKKLFKKDWHGRRLVDTPRMLLRIEEMAAELEKHGEFLMLEQLQEPDKEGVSPLERLCACGKLRAVVETLNHHGQHVTSDLLLNADKSPTALLQAATEWEQVDGLFTFENWQHSSKEELDTVLRNLPEAAREQVSNAKGLRVQLETHHRLEQQTQAAIG